MLSAGGAVRRLRLRHWAALTLPAALLLQWLASQFPAVVEDVYARRLFPPISQVQSLLFRWIPFSMAEWLLLLGLAAPLVLLVRRPPWRRLLWGALGAAGILYMGFVLLWGLNYQRQPLPVLLGLQVAPSPESELIALCTRLVTDANQLREGLPEDADGVLLERVPDVLARTPQGLDALGRETPFLLGAPGQPKPVFFSRAFSHLGISGIYAPFTGEANVNVEVPAPDLPFSASHEMAHRRGIAREDEANYVAWLACRRHPDRDFRYSGTLSASLYALQALNKGVDPKAARQIGATRSPAVVRDVRALAEWSERFRGAARVISRNVNDAYLRTQGQADGVHSYGRMVDLLLAEARDNRRLQ